MRKTFLLIVCVTLFSLSSNAQDVLYHYTTEDNMKNIIASKKLNPSLKANNPNDARYGDGQYLSDIEPGTKTNGQLAKIFINVPFQGSKFAHYIKIDVSGLNAVKGRDNVFVIRNTKALDLNGRILGSGKNE